MYRQYEDPRALEKQLAERKSFLKGLIELSKRGEDVPEDAIISVMEDVSELEQRVAWAWADEEFDLANA